MTLGEAAEILEIDLEKALSYYMEREDLYLRFLLKYPESAGNWLAGLRRAVEDRDYGKIEYNAHSLKGISANMGLDNIAAVCDIMVKELRAKCYDNIAVYYERCTELCGQAIEILEKLGMQ